MSADNDPAPARQASVYESQLALLGEQHSQRVAELQADIGRGKEEATALRNAAQGQQAQAQDLEQGLQARIEQVGKLKSRCGHGALVALVCGRRNCRAGGDTDGRER